MRRILKYILAIGVLFLTAYICFYNLSLSLLENWDEAFYAEITKRMLRTGSYFVTHWNNAVFLDKPPLNFWINSILASIFGLSEVIVRIPSAVSAFILILLTVRFVYRRYGTVPAVFAYSAVALNNIFIWRARTGNLDALASLLIFVIFLLILSKRKNKYPLLGISLALLFLQKASLMFYPFIIFIVHEMVFYGKKVQQNLKQYIVLMLYMTLPILLWLAVGTVETGKSFYEYYLFSSDQGVASIKLSEFNWHYIEFVYYSLQRYLVYPMMLGLLCAIWNFRKNYYFLLTLFATSLILALSLTDKYNNWYIMPTVPFFAIITGYGIYNILNFGQKFINKTALSIVLLAPLLFISYKTFVGHIVPQVNREISFAEVKSAREIKKLSKSTDRIMRLDYSYPVTIYYSDRQTNFYTHIDAALYQIIKEAKILWVVGKNGQVELFLKDTHGMEFESIRVGEETVLRRLK